MSEQLTATERVKLEYIRKLIDLVTRESTTEYLDRIERLLGELDLVEAEPTTSKEGL